MKTPLKPSSERRWFYLLVPLLIGVNISLQKVSDRVGQSVVDIRQDMGRQV